MKLGDTDSYSFVYRSFTKHKLNDGRDMTLQIPNILYVSEEPDWNLSEIFIVGHGHINSMSDIQKLVQKYGTQALGDALTFFYIQSNGYLDANGRHFIYDVTPQRFRGYEDDPRVLATQLNPILALGIDHIEGKAKHDLRTINEKQINDLAAVCEKAYKPMVQLHNQLQEKWNRLL